mmetsp:Transcript_12512/g.36248  ORF Transcript_12512/g.36248 Transcript_12512/m.36248 type:complete len:207 (+) Transcript_12512:1682-2302(+)
MRPGSEPRELLPPVAVTTVGDEAAEGGPEGRLTGALLLPRGGVLRPEEVVDPGEVCGPGVPAPESRRVLGGEAMDGGVVLPLRDLATLGFNGEAGWRFFFVAADADDDNDDEEVMVVPCRLRFWPADATTDPVEARAARWAAKEDPKDRSMDTRPGRLPPAPAPGGERGTLLFNSCTDVARTNRPWFSGHSKYWTPFTEPLFLPCW